MKKRIVAIVVALFATVGLATVVATPAEASSCSWGWHNVSRPCYGLHVRMVSGPPYGYAVGAKMWNNTRKPMTTQVTWARHGGYDVVRWFHIKPWQTVVVKHGPKPVGPYGDYTVIDVRTDLNTY